MAPDTARLAHLTHAVEASAVMKLFPSRPRVLALGEPTHGEDTLL
ncbi:erythromycin esterase, partial [Streptomyces halstedii]